MFPRRYFTAGFFAPRYFAQSDPSGGLPVVPYTVNFITVWNFSVNFGVS